MFKAEERVVRLSVIDQVAIRVYVRFCFCFAFPDNSRSTEATESLRKGLQATLEHWPFLGGTVRPTPQDGKKNMLQLKYQIPVVNVVESGHLRMKDLTDPACFPWTYEELCHKGMPPSQLNGDLLSPLPILDKNVASPAFGVQANFINGGLILCFNFHHSVMDGVSMKLFVKRFAENTRLCGLGPVVEDPSRDRQHISSRAVLLNGPTEFYPEYEFRDGSIPQGADATTGRIFTFSALWLTELKNNVMQYLSNNCITEWVSTSDCLCALLWLSIMHVRSTRLHPSAEAKFCLAVDARPRMDPKISSDFFGNAVICAFTSSKTSELLKTPTLPKPESGPLEIPNIAEAALRIRKTIQMVDNQYIQRRLNLFATVEDPSLIIDALHRSIDLPNSGIFLTSWVDFGVEEDFGIPGTASGCAEWARKPFSASEGGNVILPRKSGTKGYENWELLVQLSVADMEKLCGDDSLGGQAVRIVE